MQAYANAQLTPLESESLLAPVPSIEPASRVDVTSPVVAPPPSTSNPIAAIASLVLDGLSERDIDVLARRLLPHLRQPVELSDGRGRVVYTVASLAAELDL